MKANELMTNDWVLYGGKPTRVLQLEEGKDYKNAINPIPLTTEIVEKNEFSLEEIKGQKYYKYCAYYLYPCYNGGFWLGKWHNKVGFVSTIHTLYNVHELRHALRLVGLSDVADKLKI